MIIFSVNIYQILINSGNYLKGNFKKNEIGIWYFSRNY